MTDMHDDTGGQNGGGNGADDPAETAAQEGAPADRVAELEAENTQLRERALRALAEAENARKRAERDIATTRDYAIERFATDLLGVADNLSRALASVPEAERAGAPEQMRNLLAGVELTERELMRVFERYRITLIDPKGEPFDPNLHQAVAQFPSDVPAGRVAEVMQTGFKLGDRVLRAAMVAVSTGPAAAAKPAPEGAGPGMAADFKV